MSSPEVGRVSIRVMPDTSGFRRDLQRELDGIENSVELKVPVVFDVDTAALRAQLDGINERITIPVDFDPDLAGLQARLQALDASRVTIPVDLQPDIAALRARLATIGSVSIRVDLDAAAAITGLRAQLATLTGGRIDINVRVDGVALALTELGALEAIVNRLDGRRINIQVDVDVAGALAAIAAIEAALLALRGSIGAIGAGGGAGDAAGGGIGGLVTGLLQASAVASLLAVAGAAVAAAWGLVSTAIAAVPAALSLLAVPILAVVIGMDGIKAAAKTLKPEFDALGATVDKVFLQGFTKAFNTIRGLFSTVLQPGFKLVADEIVRIVQDLAVMVSTADGVTLLTNIFNGVVGALEVMRPGIRDIVDSLLILAGRAAVFTALEEAVNRFGSAFRAALINNIDTGALDAALRGLGDTLGVLGEAFAGLVHNGIELFASAAPGLNAAIASLTDFFGKFDWNALGQSVGAVFQGLAAGLAAVPQGTIDSIVAAFGRLGDVFKSQSFQADLTAMISGIPAAINLIADLTKTFASMGAGIADGLKAFDTINTKFADFVAKTNDSFAQIGKGLGVGEGSSFSKALNDIDNSIDRFFGIIPPKAEQLGTQTTESIRRGFGGSFAAASDELGKIPPVAQAELGKVPSAASAGLAPLPSALTAALSPAAAALAQGFNQMPLVVQNAFVGLQQNAVAGMAAVSAGITAGGADVVSAFSVALIPLTTTVTTAFTQLTTTVSIGMSQMGLAVTAGAVVLSTAFTAVFTTLAPAVVAGFVALQPAITAGMDGLAIGVTLGMAPIQAAMTAGIALLAITVQTGFAELSLAAVTGMTGMATSVQTGMLAVITAIQTGMVLASAAVTVGAEQMRVAFDTAFIGLAAAVTVGMANIVLAISTGMALAAAAITTGSALWTVAFTTAFVAIVATVTLGMTQISTAITAGMALATAAITTGALAWSTALTAALALMVTAATTAMQQIVTAFTTGMQQATQAVVTGADQMRLAIEQLTQQIIQLITDAMNQFRTAVETGMAAAQAAVQAGVDAMIGVLNGAVGAFFAAGSNMGAALADGLRSQAGNVAAAAAELANAAAAATASAAQIQSPSKVFMRLGHFMGKGLEHGLFDAQGGIIDSARRLVDEILAEVGKLEQGWQLPPLQGGFDGSQLHDKVQASVAEVNAAVSAGPQSEASITQVINVPAGFSADDLAKECDFRMRWARRGGVHARR